MKVDEAASRLRHSWILVPFLSGLNIVGFKQDSVWGLDIMVGVASILDAVHFVEREGKFRYGEIFLYVRWHGDIAVVVIASLSERNDPQVDDWPRSRDLLAFVITDQCFGGLVGSCFEYPVNEDF